MDIGHRNYHCITTYFCCSVSPKFDLPSCSAQRGGLSLLGSLKNRCDQINLQLIGARSLQHQSHVRGAVRCDYPQNADLPRYYSKKEKKPFPVPIIELRRAARERVKNRNNLPKHPVPPPKRGLLVAGLIPVAYRVFNARIKLINNLKKLLKVMPVHACKWCNEIHVGPIVHPFKTCTGPESSIRKGSHEWGKAVVEDILTPIDAYHLYDRLGKRITHLERFSIPRIPAVAELCIQAGVELPDYPAKRRRKPVIRTGKNEFIDADETELPDPETTTMPELLVEMADTEIVAPSSGEEKTRVAEETVRAWEEMRNGAKRLMKMYPVRTCGYCPEVHVGPTGHKAQNCGARKHQQRNGQHGWQTAILDDLIPPRYVWHVPEIDKPMEKELRSFYGQAPAVVELCLQAGADVPHVYKSTMRLDVGIPTDVKEAEMAV
ncbi:hypothetical protein M569_13885 [Genlisea aurea]|uniref:APO domain-containing protein n=1 Tax=Genlisea aurea TaxID=192259 RepID=S8C2B3_9LAMI|nr:hypothetical protein M569_13885 [Genlisea aurea]